MTKMVWSMDTKIAIAMAIATIVGNLATKFPIELYKNRIRKRDELVVQQKDKENLVIDYSEKISEYLGILNKDLTDDYTLQFKQDELLSIRLESEKLKNKIVMSFSIPEYWSIDVIDDFISIQNKVVNDMNPEVVLLNVIEQAQILLNYNMDNNGGSGEELELLGNCIPILLSKYHRKDFTGKNSREAIERLFSQYEMNVNSNNEIENKGFDIKIRQDESVREYFERIFTMLNKIYPNELEKKIKGVPGRLSKSPEVTWRNKAKVPVGNEKYMINVNLKRNVAEEFIKDLLFNIDN